jgi:hypothetical protein
MALPCSARRGLNTKGTTNTKVKKGVHLTGIYSFETFVSFVVEIDLPLRTVDPSF